MLLVTTDAIGGKRVAHVHGLVQDNTVRAKAIGRDGEITQYSRLLIEAREEAAARTM